MVGEWRFAIAAYLPIRQQYVSFDNKTYDTNQDRGSPGINFMPRSFSNIYNVFVNYKYTF